MSDENTEDGVKANNHPLQSAPKDVQLAVDLIYLLESNNIDPATALSALEMVNADLLRKLSETR
ncbi:pleiotropic regulatory protein RsmS [Vibrio ulleungensis]|uniref:Pleiotropic regulatory protein RsmS n=1 Tax=Vibrio ulleungensis TaxID=2807619 RepID=A0ABS2HHN4_9VIBR|nr:pleiotropic regulatory protein RsmS [Vibrio ulleungensis]MBM7036186.1 pleiotropic regulatory protein RsmS [Vibrio ulleungensis]